MQRFCLIRCALVQVHLSLQEREEWPFLESTLVLTNQAQLLPKHSISKKLKFLNTVDDMSAAMRQNELCLDNTSDKNNDSNRRGKVSDKQEINQKIVIGVYEHTQN